MAVFIGVVICLGSTNALLPLSLRRAPKGNLLSPTTTLLYNADIEQPEQPPNGASIVLQNEDERTRLASAFAALDEGDQYDAVLTGLCAKILDDTEEEEQALVALQDPISLLNEMNLRRVPASGRSLMALVDATAKTHNAPAMANILTTCKKNGAMSEYGTLQTEIMPLPNTPTTRVKCPDGSFKTRQERLDDADDVPTDDRGSEVASALAFSTVVGFCGVCNVLGISDITPFTNVLVFALIGVGVVDNFFDLLKAAASLAKKQADSELLEKVELPQKEDMPLSLGTGQLSGTVVRGLTRLVNVDTERECQCEAAAFFAAYTLGLPCFAFRPNALEAAVLIFESTKKTGSDSSTSNAMDSLLSNVGILKVLIWLMAPVAMESSKHPQLIVSDPREGRGFLERLEEKKDLLGSDESVLSWLTDQEEDLLKWAYMEADLLLRNHKSDLKELTERLAGGAATVGDCVAVLEKW